jgi:hypothetical protein
MRTQNVSSGGERAERWPRIVRRFAQLAFVFWAVLGFVIATSLAAQHLYVLPAPDANGLALARSLRSLTGDERGTWSAFHVLYARCQCSQNIVEHLGRSARPSNTREHVLLVGTERDLVSLRAKLPENGFRLHRFEAEVLKQRFHIQSAPLLIVTDAEQSVRYAGGYSERKQGPLLEDVEIVRSLQSNFATRRLPIFGCAVSKELQALLDPLSLARISGK